MIGCWRAAHGVLLLVTGAVLGAGDAHAQREQTIEPSESVVTDEAREAFVRGTSLARNGRWRDALVEFERSASLRAHPVTTYNIGFCERALGSYTRARKQFAAALTAHESRQGGELPPDLFRSARSYLEEAEARIVRIEVTLEPHDAAVSMDGRPLEREGSAVLLGGTREPGRPEKPPSRRFTLLVDPGLHVFVVARAGAADVVVERTFAEGARTSLTLTALTPSPRARSAPASPAPTLPRVETIFDGTPASALLGIGAASTTAAGILAVIYAVNRNELEDVCIDGECPSDREAIGTATWVALGVGAATLAAGIVMVVVRWPSAPRTTSMVVMQPAFGSIRMRVSW